MDVQPFLPSRHSASTVTAIILTLLIGCASPGPPRAPSLQLAQQVANLSAERRGNDVILHWSTAATTTDGLPLTRPVTAEICRGVLTGTRPPPSCASVLRIPVYPGVAEATDRLSPSLALNANAILVYQVELRNSHERSAGISNQAFAAAGPAPPPITTLQVRPTEQGALLLWSPGDAADAIELERKTAPPPAGQPPRKAATPVQPQELRLHASGAPTAPFAPDAGGTLDTTARRGETYTYTAERIRTVITQGHTLTLHSAPSPPVTLVMTDSYPPQPPSAVQAIATDLPTGAAIDLSWHPNTEPDLAGYLVFRQDAPETPLQLTAKPIPESAFRDTTVRPGHAYAYTVRAIDTTGNQSPPSAPAKEQLRLP